MARKLEIISLGWSLIEWEGQQYVFRLNANGTLNLKAIGPFRVKPAIALNILRAVNRHLGRK